MRQLTLIPVCVVLLLLIPPVFCLSLGVPHESAVLDFARLDGQGPPHARWLCGRKCAWRDCSVVGIGGLFFLFALKCIFNRTPLAMETLNLLQVSLVVHKLLLGTVVALDL